MLAEFGSDLGVVGGRHWVSPQFLRTVEEASWHL